jgi:hypothetical protein
MLLAMIETDEAEEFARDGTESGNRDLRFFSVGRKDYRFFGSDSGR